MADNENLVLEGEIATSVGVARLWQRIKDKFVQKDGDKVLSDNNFSDEDKQKLDSLEPLQIASADKLGGIKIGTGLAIAQDGTVSVESAGEVQWEDVQGTPTTLAGYGIADAATKDELEEVRQSVSKVYKFKGSVNTYDDLANIANPTEGDTYNVKDTGKNYAWTVENEEGFWDDLGGVFEIEPLTANDIDIITGYAVNEEAFDEILENGGDIELGADLTLSEQKTITSDVVLDLNGNDINSTIAKTDEKELFVVNGAKLTIKGNGNVTTAYRLAAAVNGGEVVIEGGNFDCGDVGFTAAGANSSIVFNGGSISAVEGGLGSFDGASIEVNGGTIEVSDNFPLFTNGTAGRGGNTIVMNDGELIGNITSNGYEAIGVYIANNDTFVMNGGRIVGHGGAGILMRAGNVTINGGEIVSEVSENRPAGSTGWIGDNKTKMSQSAIIYHESANYPGKDGMSLTINGGSFTGVAHSVEVLSNEAEPAVTITGGEFSPAYPEN